MTACEITPSPKKAASGSRIHGMSFLTSIEQPWETPSSLGTLKAWYPLRLRGRFSEARVSCSRKTSMLLCLAASWKRGCFGLAPLMFYCRIRMPLRLGLRSEID